MTNRLIINKDIYLWAIKESKIDFDKILLKFKNIEAWISEEAFPTFRQVEDLARFLNVPLGYMLLSKPPKTDIIESEFRTIGNKIPEISKDLKDTLFHIGRKRDWLSEYRKEKGWESLITEDLLHLANKDIYSISSVAKKYLELDEFWYKEHNNNRDAFNYLRNVLEISGITVMQNGIVGSNTRRKLDIDEFRGFLLYDEIAPIIFINSNDSQTGKIFTLIHEYTHFLFQEDDVLIEADLAAGANNEKNINEVTAEFLIPTSHLEELWDNNKMNLKQIEELSGLFHVSMIALAIKLRAMKKISQNLVSEVQQYTKSMWNNRSKITGGHPSYYNVSKSRLGSSFMATVIQGAESGDISYTHAFKLLDNSVKVYDHFKKEFLGYGA